MIEKEENKVQDADVVDEVEVEVSAESTTPSAGAAATESATDSAGTAAVNYVNMDAYLGLNRFEVDEGNPHIVLVDDIDPAEFNKLVRVCPAALYRVENGTPSFDYAGCLECGTCRIACGDTLIKQWQNPQPTMGIQYRYG